MPKEKIGKGLKDSVEPSNEIVRMGEKFKPEPTLLPPSRMITINIPLTFPENNIVDIHDLLKEAGVLPLTPPRQNETDSESDLSGEGLEGFQTPDPQSPSPTSTQPGDFSSEKDPLRRILENEEINTKGAKIEQEKKVRKKKARMENYDFSDPFIDDSELAPSQRYTGEIRRSVDGFFVWKGPLQVEDSDIEYDFPQFHLVFSKRKSTAMDVRVRKISKKGHTGAEDNSNNTIHGSKKTSSSQFSDSQIFEVIVPQKLIFKDNYQISSIKYSGQPILKSSSQSSLKDSNHASTSKAANIIKDSSIPAHAPLPPPNRNGTISLIVNPMPHSKNEANNSCNRKDITSPSPTPRFIPEVNKTPGKTLKPYPVESINPEVQKILDTFKSEVAAESFALKNRFPPNLKPHLLATINKAYEYNEFNENFFKIVTNILPYNKYTVTRLCKRTLYPIKIPELEQQRDNLMKKFEGELKEIIPEILQRHASLFSSELSSDLSSANTDRDATANHTVSSKGKKFEWTVKTKGLLWQIIQMEMAITMMKNDLMGAEDKSERLSEQKMRKILYQRLLELWPPGWMSSYEISRMYSASKRQTKREEKTIHVVEK
ncbi:hypothetical protein G9A89_005388 [Geosiphon pyriformis]|nr:hypothetical protein G9A89_005388 [Geosiphon pyriformis]